MRGRGKEIHMTSIYLVLTQILAAVVPTSFSQVTFQHSGDGVVLCNSFLSHKSCQSLPTIIIVAYLPDIGRGTWETCFHFPCRRYAYRSFEGFWNRDSFGELGLASSSQAIFDHRSLDISRKVEMFDCRRRSWSWDEFWKPLCLCLIETPAVQASTSPHASEFVEYDLHGLWTNSAWYIFVGDSVKMRIMTSMTLGLQARILW